MRASLSMYVCARSDHTHPWFAHVAMSIFVWPTICTYSLVAPGHGHGCLGGWRTERITPNVTQPLRAEYTPTGMQKPSAQKKELSVRQKDSFSHDATFGQIAVDAEATACILGIQTTCHSSSCCVGKLVPTWPVCTAYAQAETRIRGVATRMAGK